MLIFYGETDQSTPIDASIQIWRKAVVGAGRSAPDILRLRGCDHSPTLKAGTTIDDISPAYEKAMIEWLNRPGHLD